ncbi:MAG TPA: PP2C family protein-serine/threonine phosphatase [Mycobacteriales bacterium]|nr:PP2C family protein-serine/threonine phosphatase [Mycobacteriales bacterium]
MLSAGSVDLRALLDAVEAASPTQGVDALAAELAKMVGATEVSFLIADVAGGTLERLARASSDGESVREREAADTVPLVGTAAGAALRTQTVQVVPVPAADEVWLFAPVTERGEAVGVLELLLPYQPDSDTVDYVADAAHALAYVVIADRRYTDLYEWSSRSVPLTLEAEIQRRLLPLSYTCEAGQFTLGGWLVPATAAGGDTFDFALDRDVLNISITDAMGHGVAAALLATLGVGSLRNSRREGLPLVEHARQANEALIKHAKDDQFLTGQLFRIELATGLVQVVNAGHVLPMLVRDGSLVEVQLEADPAFGIDDRTAYHLQRFSLLPGDRLVLLTDGMLERSARGADVAGLLPQLGHLHPREAVQALTGAVVAASNEELDDDATALVLDWYGGPDQTREASSGSTDDRAST